MCFSLTQEVVHESGKINGLPTAMLPSPLPPHCPDRGSNSDPHAGIPGHGAWRQEEGFEIAPGLGDGRPVKDSLGPAASSLWPWAETPDPDPHSTGLSPTSMKMVGVAEHICKNLPSKLCGSRTYGRGPEALGPCRQRVICETGRSRFTTVDTRFSEVSPPSGKHDIQGLSACGIISPQTLPLESVCGWALGPSISGLLSHLHCPVRSQEPAASLGGQPLPRVGGWGEVGGAAKSTLGSSLSGVCCWGPPRSATPRQPGSAARTLAGSKRAKPIGSCSHLPG